LSVDGLKNGEGMELFTLTLDNIRGTHVKALLARPAKEKKYPALVIYNAAGVGPLDKAAILGYAKSGWLVINVSAHDLPVDESPDFYNKLKAGELKNYYSIGSEDRETSYFLRMFLGDVRAVEYVATRPDWDGKTLLITGISQGGLQSFATAGLCPKVTGVMINVPAGCDVYGPLANPARAVSWPYWLAKFNPGKDLKKVQETAGYYDAIYFAPRIQCPTLVAVALLDVAARPAGVIAAYNAVTAPKQLIIMPMSDHYGSGGAQNDFFYKFARLRDSIQKGNEWSLPLP
ncbi:MAG: acetylxylan esterase, partial [Candidatus Methylacidiphilales bacterium]